MEISEKDKKIVAAVNCLASCAPGEKSKPCNPYGLYTKGGDIYLIGSKKVYINGEEYNQCIEDMGFAKWISKDDFGYVYKVHLGWCNHNNVNTSSKELLKEHCDYSFYDKPTTKLNKACDSMEEFKAAVLVYTQDMHNKDIPPPIGSKVVYDLNEIAISMNDGKKAWIGCELLVVANVGFSGGLSVLVSDDFSFSDVVNNAHFKPIKTPEQIKQDKLDAQIDSDYALLVNKGFRLDPLALKCLQSHGRMAEPK